MLNLTTLEGLVYTKLNDATGEYYPDASGALNEAQRLFVLLSLCLEKTVTFSLNGGVWAYNLLGAIPDFLLCRRIFNSLGKQLRPATIAELQSLNSSWQTTPGTPMRYVMRGLDFLALYPQPASADTLNIVYACCPVTMASGSDTPQIRGSSQYALVNHASYVLRNPEGGQEMAKFKGYFDEFLAEAKRTGDLVRERNRDSGLETPAMPFELQRVK